MRIITQLHTILQVVTFFFSFVFFKGHWITHLNTIEFVYERKCVYNIVVVVRTKFAKKKKCFDLDLTIYYMC